MTRIINFADGFTSSTAPSEFSGAYINVDLQTVSTGNELNIALDTGFQKIPVVSDGGNVVMSNIVKTGTKQDGMVLTIVGTSDINSVEVPFNDTANGIKINDKCILKNGYTLTIQWEDEILRWIEIGRTI